MFKPCLQGFFGSNMDYQKVIKTLVENNRIKAYSAIVIIGSMLYLSEDYKIDKRNLLNQWFVKLGWFWTNLFIIPILFSTIRTNDKEAVSRAIFRIITCTVIWYSSVNLFQLLDNLTDFDISGHTFLLIYSNLLITSELKLTESSSRLGKSNSPTGGGGDYNYYSDVISNQKSNLNKFFRTSLFILSLLWDFMLIQTALYYHTWIQKYLAALWAFGSWYLVQVNFYQHQQPGRMESSKPRIA